MAISDSVRKRAEAVFKAAPSSPGAPSKFNAIVNRATIIREKSARLRKQRIASEGEPGTSRTNPNQKV